MKKLLPLIFAISLTLSACGTAGTQSAPPAQTSTRTLTPMATQTPIPPTATITPLPTIPTFTPTFDVSTIVTVTPAEKAVCPTENAENTSSLDFEAFPSGNGKYVNHPTINIILNFLNSGGSIENLKTELSKIDANFTFQDLTNDNTSDLILVSGLSYQIVNILYCDHGKYIMFPKDITEGETLGSEQVKFLIQDLNQNNIPDVISIGRGKGLEINILEWDNKTFKDTELATQLIGAGNEFQIADVNDDNISEIILKGMPNNLYYPGEPLRSEIDIFQWNGEIFSQSINFTAPEYRFQAIQDGDRYAVQGNYNEALKWYQEAIYAEYLDWWSDERFENSKDAALNFKTPSVLAADPAEYPSLAAYAYYRITLLHLVQGQEAEAASTYQTLQETFDTDPYAAPYIDMATAFWESYQSTHRMYDGCAAAIQYAVEHPEILTPLGSGYHGLQSHMYVPADVCPFR